LYTITSVSPPEESVMIKYLRHKTGSKYAHCDFNAEARRKKAAESIPEAPQFATGFCNLAGANKKQIGGDFNKKVMMEETKAHAKKQNHTPSKADVPVDKSGVPKETAASLKVC